MPPPARKILSWPVFASQLRPRAPVRARTCGPGCTYYIIVSRRPGDQACALPPERLDLVVLGRVNPRIKPEAVLTQGSRVSRIDDALGRLTVLSERFTSYEEVRS